MIKLYAINPQVEQATISPVWMIHVSLSSAGGHMITRLDGGGKEQ